MSIVRRIADFSIFLIIVATARVKLLEDSLEGKYRHLFTYATLFLLHNGNVLMFAASSASR